MAPIVLNTLAMPTLAIHGVIAKTKTVLRVFLENVTATSASPMIWVLEHHVSIESPAFTASSGNNLLGLPGAEINRHQLTSLYASVI